MNFIITRKNDKARVGRLQTLHGVITTPVFLPIATYGAVKNLTTEELRILGSEIVLSNTYHLWLRPGINIIKKIGGLHRFMNWDGPILTDSGGFQIFSLAKYRRLTKEGVEFSDPLNGKKYLLTPEKSIQIQLDLGSDIVLVLDDCPPYPCSYKDAKRSLNLTFYWAERAKKYFDKKIIATQFPSSKGEKQKKSLNKPLLFGIIQGSIYKDLRQESARQITAMDFDGFAIGGVSVGEPRRYVWEVLKWVMPFLPENKPRHLLGVGKPEEIVKAINCGIDMFDCVIPTREARHGRLYKFSITNFQFSKKNFYNIINITNTKFKKDFRPIDENCTCYACQNYSRAYLNHLFKMKELLGYRLATIHNLYFYTQVVNVVSKFCICVNL